MSGEPTHQPERAVWGHCPECWRVCVVFNNYEVWPLVRCECGWVGGTLGLIGHTRITGHASGPWQEER
jgi:hypothetical protein